MDPRIQVEQDHVRQADLMWTKKVWRKIDLRQKLNHPLYFSGQKSNGYASFFESLRGSVLSGDLAVSDPGCLGTDDMFHTKFSTEQLDSILNPMENAKTMDPYTLLDTVVSFIDPIETSDVLMYELKEDWFFDKERSVMEVRIIGICPLVQVRDEETGEFRGYKKLFWIPYNQLRYRMLEWPVYDVNNAAEVSMTFHDLFNKRKFESLIIKESNVYDRYIMQYAKGENAILESDRIQRNLLEFEHDLWSY